jgi:YgiT-type zinc finger domain-containing protein
MEGERCDFCQFGRLHARRVREYYRVGRGLVVIDDVPAYVCDRCGERYYEAQVAKRMRVLSRRRSRVKEKVFFPRVSFKKVGVSA